MKVPERSLKRRLAAGELTIGSWISCADPVVCELMARTGFDWLVIDMEHGAMGLAEQVQLLQVIRLAGVTPLVRVGANDPFMIKRAMDGGATGVLVPMVMTADEARRAVEAVHYPPAGRRGVGLSQAQGWGRTFEEYRRTLPEKAVVVVQIEHADAVANLEEILAVEGVDGFIVGPYDLSGSLGRPGDWDHPSVRDALSTIETIMNEGEKPGGYHVVGSDRTELRARIDSGYRFIAYGDDMVWLREKLDAEMAFLRSDIAWDPA